MCYICKDCISIPSIQKEIENNTTGVCECSFCGLKKDVADKSTVYKIIENNFFNSIKSIDECSTLEQIYFWSGSDNIPAKEVFDILDNFKFGCSTFKDEIIEHLSQEIDPNNNIVVLDDGTLDNNIYETKWHYFIDSIQHTIRYFNFDAKLFLDDLFSIIHTNNIINNIICTELIAGTSIYRARIANTSNLRERIINDPVSQLGAVPNHLATDQRMTPTGISALYASIDRSTCFSEIRAITGDIIISAEFEIKQDLRLLDLDKLDVFSRTDIHPFDKEFKEKSHKSNFLKKLIYLLSRPATGNKSTHYLQTQVIFEYLRINYKENIHGVIFSSVQNGMNGKNVVIFPEYSKIEDFSYTENSQTSCEEIKRSDTIDYPGFFFKLKPTKKCVSKAKNETLFKFKRDSIQIFTVAAVITNVIKEPMIISEPY